MTNLIAEYWDIDGVSLHALGTHLSNLGGSFTGGIPMRGDNLQVPYRPGTIWIDKTPGQRTLSLAVTVTDAKPDGSRESSMALRLARFNANLTAVRRLLWRDTGEQFELTKRWYAADFTAASPSAALTPATALAAFSDGMEPQGDDPLTCTFLVDVLLADPYFYGTAVSVDASVGVDGTVNNPGDARAVGNHATLTFVGPLTNPIAELDGITVGIGLVIASGDSVIIDLAAWTATRSSDGANVISSLTRSGTRSLLPVPTGASVLSLTGSGTGHITLSFRPPYL